MIASLTLALSTLLVLARPTIAEDPPSFVLKWGSHGTGPGQFNSPTAITVDGDGNVYVVDHDRVQKFTNDGLYVGAFGGTGSANGSFNGALDAAVDPSGNIYVTDSFNSRVQVFDSSFNYLRQWSTIYSQSYIALDPTGQFAYLARPDTIRKFRTSDGTLVGQWQYTTGPGPYGFAVGPSGSVYVSSEHYFVKKFSDTGALLAQWGGFGTGDGQFGSVAGVAVGPDESVFAADVDVRIQKFSSSGQYLSQWGSFGSGDGQFGGGISDLAVDAAGNIFVLDSVQSRVEKFSNHITAVTRSTWGHLKRTYRR